MEIKTHLAVGKELPNGCYRSSTLCGRESGKTIEINAEINAETDYKQITCKICQKILKDPQHWRYRKWLI